MPAAGGTGRIQPLYVIVVALLIGPVMIGAVPTASAVDVCVDEDDLPGHGTQSRVCVLGTVCQNVDAVVCDPCYYLGGNVPPCEGPPSNQWTFWSLRTRSWIRVAAI